MHDLIYSLLLLAGLIAVVLIDDRRTRRQLRRFANRLGSR